MCNVPPQPRIEVEIIRIVIRGALQPVQDTLGKGHSRLAEQVRDPRVRVFLFD